MEREHPDRNRGVGIEAWTPTRLAALGTRSRGRQLAGSAIAVLGIATVTLVFLPFRDDTTSLSKGFAYLTIVVVATSVGGLGSGVLSSVLGFLSFNFFYLPPYNTFVIARAEDVVVLFVFLGVAIFIAVVLARSAERADAAEARELEVTTLGTLSAELVSAVPGRETYRVVLVRLLEVFGFAAGSLWTLDPSTRELLEQVTVGADAGVVTPDRDAATDEPPQRLPLAVGGRVLGLFLLRRERPALTPAESRVMRAFSDQFALVLERDRLLRAAAEAEAFRQTERLRRSLLAAVSHDLRSPLAAIKASASDLLSRDVQNDPEAHEALVGIDSETDRLISLITNLLDMSRIEDGTLQARIAVVEITELITAAVDRAEARWPGVRFHLDIHDDATLLRADAVFLDRVLANLVANAARAGSGASDGTVTVQARKTGTDVVVRVVDHGPGVAPETRELLFYPFYGLDERHPRLGSGLGLAIAKGFMTLMDGRIWIEDTPGGGATFALSLPSAATVLA